MCHLLCEWLLPLYSYFHENDYVCGHDYACDHACDHACDRASDHVVNHCGRGYDSNVHFYHDCDCDFSFCDC